MLQSWHQILRSTRFQLRVFQGLISQELFLVKLQTFASALLAFLVIIPYDYCSAVIVDAYDAELLLSENTALFCGIRLFVIQYCITYIKVCVIREN